MLKSLKEIIGYKIDSKNGNVGKCKDALFDDEKWTVRYLDIDTGGWLPGRRILLSPISIKETDWISKKISIILTKKEIEDAPGIESDVPVSKQWEESYYNYFGWPHYASGGYIWGLSTYPNELLQKSKEQIQKHRSYDAHLRSANEVIGYKIEAKDDHFGSVKDLIIDEETWAIRYVVIDTVKWIPSKNVLIAPDWVKNIDWSLGQIEVDMTKDQIKDAPPYDPTIPVNRKYESKLYDYYGRPVYWDRSDYII